MNRNLYTQTGAAFLGSLLLYQTSPGLNILVIALLIIALLVWKNRLAPLPALLFGLAGLLVATTASVLSLVLFCLVLCLLVSLAYLPISWAAALPEGLYRLFSGGWHIISTQQQSSVKGFSFSKSMLLSLPPLALTVIFYALYANANPVFAQKANLAQLNLPDFSWFLLFFGLLYLSFGLVNALPASGIAAWDSRQPDILLRIRRKKPFSNPLWLKYEYKTALIALGLLNALLLLFHSIDLTTLLGGKPTDGVSYAEWVHQGVGTLIVSIVMAVALLLWVFRGNLNFFRENKNLKALAKVWIIQNLLLVFTTALKNSWYIGVYGLTYKRIGVGVYLLLVLVGLLTTWSKISHKQTLWWMIKGNFKAALLVLLFTAALPWARIITGYNLEKAQVSDISYLLELPLHNTDQLLPHLEQLSQEQQRQLLLRQQALINQTLPQHWRSWTILNHYAAQNL